MGLETATYISGLVATNPVGATDPKSAGDDHIRLIKSTILATFAAITGAVTASHTELNNLTGVTGKTGTGNLVLSASPTLTGTVTAATVAATTLTGAGSGITALNASNLASGTVPDARFPATLPALNGSALTNLNGTAIATGTVANARLDLSAVPAASLTGSHTLPDSVLSTNVPLINATNTFTIGQVIDAASASNSYLRYKVGGVDKGFVALGDGVGGTAGNLTVRAEAGLDLMSNGANIRLAISSSGNFDFKAGTVTRSNASATEVGYAGSPLRSISTSDNTAATDSGKTIRMTGGSGQTFTLDGDPPTDARVQIINDSGNNWQLAASGTLTWIATTGTRTLATGTTTEAHHLGSGNWRLVNAMGTVS